MDVAILAGYVLVQSMLRACVPLCTNSSRLGSAFGSFEVAGAFGRLAFVVLQKWVVAQPVVCMMVLNGSAVMLAGGVLALDYGRGSRLSSPCGREQARDTQNVTDRSAVSHEEGIALFAPVAIKDEVGLPTSTFFAPPTTDGEDEI